MSKSTRSLIIAATAATLFLAGCATQGTTDGGSFTTGNSCGGRAPVAAPVNTCKGMASCKKRHHKMKRKMKRKVAKAVEKKTDASTTTTTTTTN
jgi:hypothetical protein